MIKYVQDGYVAAGYVQELREAPRVAFVLGAETLLFVRRPTRPPRSLSFVQPDIRSVGAERTGADYLVKDRIIDLYWPHMPAVDKDLLMSFWREKARGMASTFDYVDGAGVSTPVRFATPALDRIRERAYDAFEVHVQLRVQ